MADPVSRNDGGSTGLPVRRESPLARFDLARRASEPRRGAGVSARERPFCGHLNLRGDPTDGRFVSAVCSVLGVELPIVANTAIDAGETTIFWLGPDEWLLVTSGDRCIDLEHRLRASLVGLHAALTDVNGGQTVLVLRGAPVRDVLAKGCPLDLHPRAFGPGRCAQSHLAKAPVLLRVLEGEAAFELIVRRSFADYVWTWLGDAAAEYGLEVEA